MQWVIETPTWRATIEVLDPNILEAFKFVEAGLGKPFGIPAANIDPEVEVKHVIQYEIASELFKRYNNGKAFHEVVQDVINHYEGNTDAR